MWTGNPINGYINGTIGDTMNINLFDGQVLTSRDSSIISIITNPLVPYLTIFGIVNNRATITASGLGTTLVDSNIAGSDFEFWPLSITNSNPASPSIGFNNTDGLPIRGLKQIFLDLNEKIKSIPDLSNIILNPKQSGNFQKTQSNVNQRFKFIGIWNDQIDAEIQSSKSGEPIILKGFVIKCPAIFIEFIPEDPNQIGGRVTQYLDAKLYLHIYSDELNTPSTKLNPNNGDLMDANFEIHDLRDTVKSEIMGFRPTNCSALMARYDGLDYKHGTITKYILGFTCPFTDFTGSIFDKSVFTKKIDATLQVTSDTTWVSKTLYTQNISVIRYGNYAVSPQIQDSLYLCITTNSDSLFDPAKWQYLNEWKGQSGTYRVGLYVWYVSSTSFGKAYVYVCNTENTETIFNPSHWTLICAV